MGGYFSSYLYKNDNDLCSLGPIKCNPEAWESIWNDDRWILMAQPHWSLFMQVARCRTGTRFCCSTRWCFIRSWVCLCVCVFYMCSVKPRSSPTDVCEQNQPDSRFLLRPFNGDTAKSLEAKVIPQWREWGKSPSSFLCTTVCFHTAY